MNKITFIPVLVLLVFLSGCVGYEQTAPSNRDLKIPDATGTPAITPSITQAENLTKRNDLPIDNISLNLTSFYEKKWYELYTSDELDCSRMSTYFWNYIRSNYHVAPKIVVSYQRQHAWLALKVSDVGNSSDYRQWNVKGMDYYYLEATIPKLVVDDGSRFLINGQPYTSSEFYNATIYVFDSPQEANDFHADYSRMRGWNQEFRLKKDDMDKIEKLLLT